MTLSTIAMMTYAGGMLLANLFLLAFAVVLLVQGTMRASHPGSMDPNYNRAKELDNLQA
jgi:fructose 1,6-bisphosphatase